MKKLKKSMFLGSLALLAFSLGACKNDTPKETTTKEIETTSFIDETTTKTIIPTTTEIESYQLPLEENSRVFYEIFTGSFSDSNGDKQGDLRGIINRLDYLNDGNHISGESLGIQGIWLTPIFRSPSYHKYDTTDYYKIDGTFGSDKDLKELIEKCHKRGIKLILDLVLNHTATNSNWFTSFQQAHKNNDTESKWYDWYSWSKTATSTAKWNKISGTSDYYECNFDNSMPELNYDNEEVRKEILNVGKYWLEFGVDGFRFDAAKYIYYNNHQKSAEFWNWYCTELKKIKSDVYTVAEVWDSDSVTNIYQPYVNCFDFQTSQGTGYIASAAKGSKITNYTTYISNYINSIQKLNPDAMLVAFESNHDVNRTAGWLTISSQYKMAANLYLLTPGSPFIYYGEEIAMKGSRGANENTDANRRLAMQWGDNDKVKNPTGATWTKGHNGTVLEQQEDSNSVLNYYKKVIAFRNKHLEIAKGKIKEIRIDDSKLGGFELTYEGKTYALIHNTQSSAIEIDLSKIGTYTSIDDFVGLNDVTLNGTTLTVGAYTSVLLK